LTLAEANLLQARVQIGVAAAQARRHGVRQDRKEVGGRLRNGQYLRGISLWNSSR
jgi:hypothetical protein